MCTSPCSQHIVFSGSTDLLCRRFPNTDTLSDVCLFTRWLWWWSFKVWKFRRRLDEFFAGKRRLCVAGAWLAGLLSQLRLSGGAERWLRWAFGSLSRDSLQKRCVCARVEQSHGENGLQHMDAHHHHEMIVMCYVRACRIWNPRPSPMKFGHELSWLEMSGPYEP